MSPPLVLASASPRRRDLLRMVGYEPQIVPADVDESPGGSEAPQQYVTRLAATKARAVARAGALTLGADTVVVLNGKVYGKPDTVESAVAMLRGLSGRTHQVITGVAVTDPAGSTALEVVVTSVQFDELSDDLIVAYAESGEPMDKAGGYAIQGYGGAFVRAVHGSYTNVVGLPLAETIVMLTAAGLPRPLVGQGVGI